MARHDLRQLRRHDLEDRGLHEEPLQVVVQLTDDFLSEVVVHLVIGAVEAPDEAADLGGRPVAQRGLDQLQGRDPPLGPHRKVRQDVGIEGSPVRLCE